LSGYLVVGKVGAWFYNPIMKKMFTENEHFNGIIDFSNRNNALLRAIISTV
jgi:hypothetical protein